MTLLNPNTGATFDKPKLLSLLMEWTTEARVISAMIKRGLADFPGMGALCGMIRATADEVGLEVPDAVGQTEGQPKPLGERELACAVLAFVVDPGVRKLLAQYVHQAHGIPMEQAKTDLYELRTYLAQTWKIQKDEIPKLCLSPYRGLSPEETARRAAQDVFRNPALEYSEEHEPWWIQEYRSMEQSLADSGLDWARRLDPQLQPLAVLFPPRSLVSAREGFSLACPAPGHVAVVIGYDFAEGTYRPCILVAPGFEEGAPVIECDPMHIRLVACWGGITGDAIQAAQTPASLPDVVG